MENEVPSGDNLSVSSYYRDNISPDSSAPAVRLVDSGYFFSVLSQEKYPKNNSWEEAETAKYFARDEALFYGWDVHRVEDSRYSQIWTKVNFNVRQDQIECKHIFVIIKVENQSLTKEESEFLSSCNTLNKSGNTYAKCIVFRIKRLTLKKWFDDGIQDETKILDYEIKKARGLNKEVLY